MLELQIEEFILDKIEFYSKQIGIPVTTNVIFDLDKWAEYYKISYPSYYKQLYSKDLITCGANYNMGERLFINKNAHDNKNSLENTIIHELVHTRYPNLEHGIIFGSFIRQIKKGKEPKIPWYNFVGFILDPIDKWMRT